MSTLRSFWEQLYKRFQHYDLISADTGSSTFFLTNRAARDESAIELVPIFKKIMSITTHMIGQETVSEALQYRHVLVLYSD